MRYLLDTNVISEIRKRKPHGGALAWMESVPVDDLLLPAVVLGELQAGAERTRLQDPLKAAEIDRWIEQLAASFQFVPMDGACFREWARLMTGKPAEIIMDGMIAATARVHDLIVATRNEADFKHFGVRIFNPFK